MLCILEKLTIIPKPIKKGLGIIVIRKRVIITEKAPSKYNRSFFCI